MIFWSPDNTPLTLIEWAEMFGKADRQIALDFLDHGRVRVSTVWMGIDHSFGEGPPLVYETMVFGGPLDQETDRYSTVEEAQDGHERMVVHVEETMGLVRDTQNGRVH